MSATKDLAIQIMNEEFGVSQGEQVELLNWSKSEITERAKAIVFGVAEGVSDPVQEYLKVKKGLEFFTQAEKNLKPYFNGTQLNKGELYFGCDIVEKESGVKYDYSVCNDPEWNSLNAAIEVAKESLKERETFLKALKKPLDTFDVDSGETFQIMPPLKTGSLGKSVTIK